MTKETQVNAVASNKVTTSNIRYQTFKDTKGLTGFVESTIASAKTLRDKVQIAAVGILMHIGQHGDKDTGCRLATMMINELKGMQVKALGDWFQAFGAVVADDGKSFGDWNIDTLKSRFNGSADNPKNIRHGAKKTHWVSFVPQNPWAGFNLDSKIEALISSADAALERAEKNSDEAKVVDIDTAKYDLLARIAQMSGTEAAMVLKGLKGSEEAEPEETVDFDDLAKAG